LGSAAVLADAASGIATGAVTLGARDPICDCDLAALVLDHLGLCGNSAQAEEHHHVLMDGRLTHQAFAFFRWQGFCALLFPAVRRLRVHHIRQRKGIAILCHPHAAHFFAAFG